ncbi:MAG: ABC transporter ATP-binding protein [Clostridiales bacterium]|nr:ABC transporter ATP-binding protein [Clostridiales bacterium]
MEQKPMSTKYLLKRFYPYFKPYLHILLFDLFCASLTSVCDLVLPLIVRFITNTVTTSPADLTVELIVRLTLLYIALRIIDVAANYYMQNRGHIMGANIEKDMRRDLFGKFQELSYGYYTGNKTGQLISRITTDLFDITEFAHHCPEEYFIAAVKIVVSFTVLIQVNVPLTLLLFALIPLMLLCAMKFRLRMRDAFKWQRSELGEINSHVEDSLLGIRVSKSFANEDVEEARFEEGNERFLSTKKYAYKNMAGFRGVTRLFDGLMYISIVFFGSIALIKGKITAGDFIAYLMYVAVLLESVRRVVEFTEAFQRGITGIERFVEVMDTEIEIEDSPDAVDMPGEVRGDIEFDNVSFSYTEVSDPDDEEAPGETYVLKDLSLRIGAGENVAIVGPSGAGKTTFCNLIPRFYDVSSGAILVDGRDIRDYKVRSLRTKIGMMQQEVYLFSDTVAGNIEYGKPGASREEIIEAAKLAGAHEFIMELPDGYDTYVGERGARLSGGQKQRISIARVFLKNPPILILDEATSSLDNESERYIQESLAELAKGRTTITIAHRLSTVKNAGRIIVLTEGGIAEEGSHEELMKKGGIYADLYNLTI